MHPDREQAPAHRHAPAEQPPELWSLLHFLLPDVFTSLSQFQSWFDFDGKKDDNGGDGGQVDDAEANKRVKVVEKLHGILQPFLLRRLKGDVETNLPRKKEIVLYAHMVETQRAYNDDLVKKTIGEMIKKISGGGSAPIGATALNNMLMQLRKNCNHPDLIGGLGRASCSLPRRSSWSSAASSSSWTAC